MVVVVQAARIIVVTRHFYVLYLKVQPVATQVAVRLGMGASGPSASLLSLLVA